MDPYHPVAITLNCQNYYFGPYTQGADFIMHDPYPIGINSTFSKWGTACNRTYGDCGCDNCVGVPWDVASRFDDANNYEAWLGLWPKTKLFNPQTFHGEDYWFRDPTDDEALAMNGLAWNHGAKGSISWTWPASDRLGVTHGQLAKVVTKSPVLDLMLGDGPHRFVAVEGKPLVDAAFWVKDGKMLVGVVNGGYADVNEPLWIAVPNITASAKLDAVVFGKEKWDFLGGKLHVDRLPGLSTSLILLDP